MRTLVNALFLQEATDLLEGELQDGTLPDEVLGGEGLLDDCQFLLVVLVDPGKDVVEHLAEEVHQFKVAVINGHFHVESGELAEMAMRPRLFCSEDRPDFEDALEIGHHAHLLVELGRLRQTGIPVKVLELENVGASLRTPSNQLRSVDLRETLPG